MHEIKTIVTPIDFSENAPKIAEAAIHVAGKFKATLHFIFVVQDFEDYTGFMDLPANMMNLKQEIFESAEMQMHSFIDERSGKCEAAGIPEVQSKVMTGDIAEQIMSYAKNNGCDMIIMGTHGYKGLERIIFGSVADKVVKNACCPVLTINPYQEECEKK
ncbi:MAG: universal stress protein [Desulfobulbus sp.]|nr:MAG: universal stress protein [Desulfobulbus sp.]